jgi:hypothetical protein
MAEHPPQRQVSPDGRWEWDGHRWIPRTGGPDGRTMGRSRSYSLASAAFGRWLELARRRPLFAMIAIFAVLFLIALVVAVASRTEPNSAPAGVAQSTPTPTDTPTPIPTPTRIATSVPTASAAPALAAPAAPATPAPGPHDLTEANVVKSIQDNDHTTTPLSNFDHMSVTGLDTGHLVVSVQPDLVKDETRAVEMGAWDTWVVSKAVLGWYPTAQDVTLQLKGCATDVNGQKSIDIYLHTQVMATTAARYDYSGLQGRTTDCAGQMYQAADHYRLQPYIWKALDGKVKDCMPDGLAK